MYVCICNAVTERDMGGAVAQGIHYYLHSATGESSGS